MGATPIESVSLMDVDPDVFSALPVEEQELARRVRLPVYELGPGIVRPPSALGSAFAGLVLDGMLLETVRLGGHAGLRLMGPGDLVSLRPMEHSPLIASSELRATMPTHLIALGSEILAAGRRWPELVAKLHALGAEQSERLLAQLIICQLPRVDERLLAMMWLLAESWGRVTPSGTVLPLRLTHSALGSLVGARRSTVTLALQSLYGRGALMRQPDGWLLLESVAEPHQVADEPIADPLEVAPVDRGWNAINPEPVARRVAPRDRDYTELRRTVARLRSEHLAARSVVRERLLSSRIAREQLLSVRERITRQRQSRQQVLPR